MSLPYYPMYPRDFFEGTQEMSLELKGAYIMLLNLMYTRGGPISDEPGYIARYLGCSVVRWTGKKGSIGIRDELVALGKIVAVGGLLRNSRADDEIKKQRSWQDQQAENGAKSGKNKDQEKPSPLQSKSESNVLEDDDDARTENEFDALEAKCRKWANGSLNLTLPSAHSLDPIVRLMKPPSGPACIEADVERGITKAATWLHGKGRQVNSFSYFEKSIIEARDERLRPNPEPEAPNGRHERSSSAGGAPTYRGRGPVEDPLDRVLAGMGGRKASPDIIDHPVIVGARRAS